jgi:outer membrane protein assembly factor BamB
VRGGISVTIPVGAGDSIGGAPVIGGGGMVYAGNLSDRSMGTIVGFDTVAKTVRWLTSGAFSGNPAYVDSLLFTANNDTAMLEVLNESDGKLAWSWTAPTDDRKFVSDVLVTRNLVFISTDRTTFAIDRTSHKTVWTEPAGGRLSLSANGILYIKNDTDIVAINLR